MSHGIEALEGEGGERSRHCVLSCVRVQCFKPKSVNNGEAWEKASKTRQLLVQIVIDLSLSYELRA